MPRKSTRKDKTIYQIAREERGITLESAATQLHMSPQKLGHFESQTTRPTDEDICSMAEVYEKPILCNEYCASVCKIGEVTGVSLIKEMQLAPAVLHVLDAFGKINKDKQRLVEDLVDISNDQCIELDEVDRFVEILTQLKSLTDAVSELDMWVKNAIAKKNLSEEVSKRLGDRT